MFGLGESTGDPALIDAATCTHLTSAGIAALLVELEDGEVAIQWRNRHWAVLLKQFGALYSLVTSEALAGAGARLTDEACNGCGPLCGESLLDLGEEDGDGAGAAAPPHRQELPQ
eukprot:gene13908-3578_t